MDLTVLMTLSTQSTVLSLTSCTALAYVYTWVHGRHYTIESNLNGLLKSQQVLTTQYHNTCCSKVATTKVTNCLGKASVDCEYWLINFLRSLEVSPRPCVEQIILTRDQCEVVYNQSTKVHSSCINTTTLPQCKGDYTHTCI